MHMTVENASRASTLSFDPMPGAWSEDTYEALERVNTLNEESLFSLPPTTTPTESDRGKGKARMDDEIALSMFIEDALASLNEYSDELGPSMPGGLWNNDASVLDGLKNVQTHDLAREHLAFALSGLMNKDKETQAGSSNDPLLDPWRETSSTSTLDSEARAIQQEIASLLLTYRELSNAGLINPGAIPP